MKDSSPKSLIAQEIKNLNFLLQNPKLSQKDYDETLVSLQKLVSLLREKI
jgi:hypothetical protein